MLVPLLLSFSLHLASAEVTIDLATAMFDENLQQFCVMQKVCWELQANISCSRVYDGVRFNHLIKLEN